MVWTGEARVAQEPRDLKYEEMIQEANTHPLPPIPIDDEDVAQIYYTSGTTGRPKGVMRSHKNVTTHALGRIAELHLTDRDVWIHVAPLFHLADAWATWAITWVGGDPCPDEGVRSKGRVGDDLEREGDAHQPHPYHAQPDGQPSRGHKVRL